MFPRQATAKVSHLRLGTGYTLAATGSARDGLHFNFRPKLITPCYGLLDQVADLVMLLVDGSFGFQMETFEFLNMCQVPVRDRVRRGMAWGRGPI